MDNGLLLVGGVVALWALSKAHTGANLQFVPLGANWDGGTLHVQIGVLNPTNGSLQLTSLAGQVYINGTAAGTLSDFTPTLILPNAQTPISITYTPSILGVFSTLLNQVSNGGGVAIAIKGSANVNGVILPVTVNFQALAA